jgi:hypothetical protein
MKFAWLVLTMALSGMALTRSATALAEEPKTLEQKCTSDAASSYRGEGRYKTYVYDVENKCDFRLRCELAIATYTAFGTDVGHKVATIKPKAHESVVIRARTQGGMMSREYHCKQI